MKKKNIVFIVASSILVILVCTLALLFNNKSLDIGEFDLANYQWEIETFPSDKNVGEVNDAKIAIEKAKELWIEKFGLINGKPYDPTQGRKVNVSYDAENECWYINGTLPRNWNGGVPHALIQKDGKVLAIWHDD